MQPYYIVLYMARRAAPSCGRNASLIVRPAGPFPLSRKKERKEGGGGGGVSSCSI